MRIRIRIVHFPESLSRAVSHDDERKSREVIATATKKILRSDDIPSVFIVYAYRSAAQTGMSGFARVAEQKP